MADPRPERMMLRPVERRVQRLYDNGMPFDEIALRFRRSNTWPVRILGYIQIKEAQR